MTLLIPADPKLRDIKVRPDLPQGEVRTSRRDGGLWIDHADPRVAISFQLLDMIVCGECRPEVTISVADGAIGWQGAVIRIEALNQTLVYRLTECLDWYCGWIMEWPD